MKIGKPTHYATTERLSAALEEIIEEYESGVSDNKGWCAKYGCISQRIVRVYAGEKFKPLRGDTIQPESDGIYCSQCGKKHGDL